eukprot:scaffold1954_cov268-Pinguiococcus_pyrenoidosus.AAC.314
MYTAVEGACITIAVPKPLQNASSPSSRSMLRASEATPNWLRTPATFAAVDPVGAGCASLIICHRTLSTWIGVRMRPTTTEPAPEAAICVATFRLEGRVSRRCHVPSLICLRDMLTRRAICRCCCRGRHIIRPMYTSTPNFELPTSNQRT